MNYEDDESKKDLNQEALEATNNILVVSVYSSKASSALSRSNSLNQSWI